MCRTASDLSRRVLPGYRLTCEWGASIATSMATAWDAADVVCSTRIGIRRRARSRARHREDEVGLARYILARNWLTCSHGDVGPMRDQAGPQLFMLF